MFEDSQTSYFYFCHLFFYWSQHCGWLKCLLPSWWLLDIQSVICDGTISPSCSLYRIIRRLSPLPHWLLLTPQLVTQERTPPSVLFLLFTSSSDIHST